MPLAHRTWMRHSAISGKVSTMQSPPRVDDRPLQAGINDLHPKLARSALVHVPRMVRVLLQAAAAVKGTDLGGYNPRKLMLDHFLRGALHQCI